MTKASRSFDFEVRDELLRDPDNAAVYLADFLESGDIELFQEGLRHVAKAQEGGVRAVATEANLSRESLYRSLTKEGKPKMETITKMLAALGLQMTVTPLHR